MKKNLRIVQKITYPDVDDPSELTTSTLGSSHAGLNHICCNGKVTIGSDLGMFIINFFLTNIIAAVFCWKVTEDLKHRSFFVSITIVLTFFIDLLLNLTAFVNPGIIKRFPLEEIMTLVPENKDKSFPSKKYIEFKGHRIESKLCILHTYLISKNITTHEFYRSYFDEVNPFDLGIKNNWKEVFCTPIPKINFPYSAIITNFELTNLETAKKNRQAHKKNGSKPKKENPHYVYKPESTDEEELDEENKSGGLAKKSYHDNDNDTDDDTDDDDDDDDIELEINLSKKKLNSKELQNFNTKIKEKTTHSPTSTSFSSEDND
ncbi:s-acyltransferase [Anaeramoeba flamelloides]|uniref:S-acyltransferase n=1 Tax=Anaeramoeba flamelloides TaxID=1746091 RepID=A0ABQ8ZBE4_9EUKA|nr:s-acyltransferase [Anaeramoeba flamelloides]